MNKNFISKLYLNFILLIFSALLPLPLHSQFRDRVWCFGDSAGIDFSNTAIPTVFGSHLRAKGSCTSICDNNSRLLFYAYTSVMIGNATIVIDSTNSVMQNGTNIVGSAWYNELTIIPKPNDPQNFYLFSNECNSAGGLNGFYYSLIDMSLNNGLGAITQKNVLISTDDFIDAITAIRHGNGRDWWIVLHTWNNTNTFYIYFVSPAGISLYSTQNIGQIFDGDVGKFCYSYVSSKFLTVQLTGKIQMLDFDRCSGNFSNPITIENWNVNSKYYCSCSISPNGNVGYVSNTNNIFGDSLTLYQYNLNASNIPQSRQTIYEQPVPASGGLHALGPDGKIYISCLDEYGYPYSDTLHTLYSDNISVINYPDSLGTACDFQPFSFNLGGHRAYWGLPNNPNYEAGAWVGSPCDSLTNISEISSATVANLFVYYSANYNSVFVNAENVRGKVFQLRIFDMIERQVELEKGFLNSQYFSKELNVKNYSKGIYIIELQTENERLVKRFVIP